MAEDTSNTRNDPGDQNRLCCGSLMEAERIGRSIVLTCTRCRTAWSRAADGRLIPCKDIAIRPRTKTRR